MPRAKSRVSQAHSAIETVDLDSYPEPQHVPLEPVRIARTVTTTINQHGRNVFSETFRRRNNALYQEFIRINTPSSSTQSAAETNSGDTFDDDRCDAPTGLDEDAGEVDVGEEEDELHERFGALSFAPDAGGIETQEAEDGSGGVHDCHPAEKRRSLDEWIPIRDHVLDQLVMHDGSILEDYRCICGRQGIYRCTHCFGTPIRCQLCITSGHLTQPFHFIENWSGKFWKKTSLNAIGFELHLGHGGRPCPTPDGSGRLMHIFHTTGLHDIRVKFCGCAPRSGYTPFDQLQYNQLLRARLFPATITTPTTAATFEALNDFHLLTTQGKLTGMDYYETRVQLVDNPGIDPPKRKYEELMRISRLWRHLKILKRAGVHLRAGGVNACEPGSCAVACLACPSDTDELEVMELFGAPFGDPLWASAAYRQLDANFRLKLKNRNIQDPSLNNGIVHIVREDLYKEHIEACGPQTEVNICDSGLHAVDHANLRGSAAYTASGVGACQCRHMMVMPAGVGDLQKGERYSNMDYIFASSMKTYVPNRLVISYDIACQWSRHFVSRCNNLPSHIRFNPASTSINYVIPKFHIAAHGASCRTRYSLNFLRYMGRTDGENIERGWAWMNPASLSTREMGPGSRADTLDDQWCSWNFRIRTRLATTLYRRLDESVCMARSQRDAHKAFTETFHPNAVTNWSKQVDAWCADPFNTRIENPFEEPAPTITMADMRRELNAEEAEELAKGVIPVHAVSASQYLVAGLQLEDQQRSLQLQYTATKSSSTTRSLAIEDKQIELRRKIAQWKHDVQPRYMPGMPTAPTTDNGNDDGGGDHAGEVWEVPLCLPSSFSPEQRNTFCAPGLEEKERRLRFAQAEDALDELRRVLRAVLALDTHKGQQTAGSGVAANTRMQNLLTRHRAKQDRIADRYRAARKALCALDPVGASAKDGWGSRLKILNKNHIQPPVSKKGQSEGRLQLTWIWLTPSGSAHPLASTDELAEGDYDESLRTEWAKSLARAERWEEEVVLIPIEMRRVLRNMVYRAREWRLKSEQAISFSSKSIRMQAGYTAYAEKQAYILEELAQDYATLWLSLFREYGIATPSGWPHMCSVERPIKRRIERRRDRMKSRVQAPAVSVGSASNNSST